MNSFGGAAELGSGARPLRPASRLDYGHWVQRDDGADRESDPFAEDGPLVGRQASMPDGRRRVPPEGHSTENLQRSAGPLLACLQSRDSNFSGLPSRSYSSAVSPRRTLPLPRPARWNLISSDSMITRPSLFSRTNRSADASINTTPAFILGIARRELELPLGLLSIYYNGSEAGLLGSEVDSYVERAGRQVAARAT